MRTPWNYMVADDAGNDAEPTSDDAGTPEAGAAPGTMVGGRYALDLGHPLGTGGMCLVYRGRDRRSKRMVAAKTLRPEYRNDHDTRARFRREARMLAFLKHPNIVKVEAFVEERDTFWVVLEYLDGPSLQQIIAERAPLAPEAIVAYLEPAAAALDHIHARGMVHLDIKPQNMLTTSDGTLKLIDLGLGQPAGRPQESMGGRTFATAAYLAPEQACGDPVEGATDLYALGCVVYELLTGAPPFVQRGKKQSMNEIITARLQGDPVPVTEARPDLNLPPWIDDVMRWALARDPGARYSDVQTFSRMFRSGVEDELPAEGEIGPAPRVIDHRPSSRFDRQWIVGGPSADPPPRDYNREGGEPDREHRSPREPANLKALARWLWWGVVALLAINLLVAGALLVTTGSLPPFGGGTTGLAQGQVVRVVGNGLQARSGPSFGAAPLGDLPPGSMLTLGGPPVADADRIWWPVDFSLNGATVTGYVESNWLQ